MEETPADEPGRDGGALCMACGLCCDGLYSKVRITPEELSLARRADGPVLEEKDGLHAALPCSFLRNSICTVYPERYATCRKYSCKLLRGFIKGAIDADTAHARVAEMQRLTVAVRAAAAATGSPLPDRPFYDKVARWQELSSKDERQAMAKAQLVATTYNLYANKHFRNVPDPAALF